MSDKLDANELLFRDDVEIVEEEDRRDRQHARERDRLVTRLAAFIVGATAMCAIVTLLVYEFSVDRTLGSDHWAVDMLTLTLVSSLSFMMGSITK